MRLTQEWLNRPKDDELRFCANLRPQLALWSLALARLFFCYTTCEDGTECSEMWAHKIQTPVYRPKKENNIRNTAEAVNQEHFHIR